MSIPPKSPMTAPNPSSQDEGPRKLGKYRLASKLASGGMATVWLASQAGPGGFEKVVALKRIHPHLASERDFVEMFLDEARIASKISHANVCGVHEFGEAGGTYYITMEYLVGEPLSRIARVLRKDRAASSNPRLPAMVARIVADACEGLHAAHELRDNHGELLQVVHRDVSPANLFLTFDGCVKVVDFGIASATNRVHQTTTGQVKGKFAYMSPEQAKGKRVDRRADVWALGVVLYELLTQQRLFQRDNPVATLSALLGDPIAAPSTVRPDIPPELDAIVVRALSRELDQRYATARELGRDLVRFVGLTGDPVGTADLADWMEGLFPDGLRRAQEHIESVARGNDTIVTPLSIDLSAEISLAEMQEGSERSSIHRRGTPVTADARGGQYGAAHLTPPSITNIPPPPPPRIATSKPSGTRRAVVMGGVALVAAAVGAGVMIGLGNDGTTDGDTTTQVDGAAPAAARAPAEQAPAAPGATAGSEPAPEDPVEERAETPPDPPTAANSAVGPTVETDPPARDPRPVHGSGSRSRPSGPRRPAGGPQQAVTSGAGAARPPAADSRATGEVFVQTTGAWANVYLGGRFLGQTPVRFNLPAGHHTIELRPMGQPPGVRVPVTVSADERTVVSRALTVP